MTNEVTRGDQHALSTDTDQIRDEICSRIAAGETLSAICASDTEDRLPNYRTIMRWLHDPGDNHAIFRRQFERAQMAYTWSWLDTAEARLLDHEVGWLFSEKKNCRVPDNYAISHLREIMQHARWRAKSLLDMFGDRIRVETEERESDSQPRIDWTKLSDSALREVQAAIYYPDEQGNDPRVVNE